MVVLVGWPLPGLDLKQACCEEQACRSRKEGQGSVSAVVLRNRVLSVRRTGEARSCFSETATSHAPIASEEVAVEFCRPVRTSGGMERRRVAERRDRSPDPTVVGHRDQHVGWGLLFRHPLVPPHRLGNGAREKRGGGIRLAPRCSPGEARVGGEERERSVQVAQLHEVAVDEDPRPGGADERRPPGQRRAHGAGTHHPHGTEVEGPARRRATGA